MLILMSLLLSDVDAATMLRVAAERSQPCADSADCEQAEHRSSFRIAASADHDYDRKAAALAITGRDCERIGKLACAAGKQRTVLTAIY